MQHCVLLIKTDLRLFIFLQREEGDNLNFIFSWLECFCFGHIAVGYMLSSSDCSVNSFVVSDSFLGYDGMQWEIQEVKYRIDPEV